MENLIQREIVKAVINARRRHINIKKTIKALAKDFDLSMHVVKAIIEMDATYGLEKVGSAKTEGKLWQRMDYTKAIKKLEDKVYELQAEIVRTNNRITKELGLKENPWTNRTLASLEIEEESLESQEYEDIPSRRYDDGERIRKIGEIIDRAKAKGKLNEPKESPSIVKDHDKEEDTFGKKQIFLRAHELIEPEKRERMDVKTKERTTHTEIRQKEMKRLQRQIDKVRDRIAQAGNGEDRESLTFKGLEEMGD